MKILVTGARGQLGNELKRLFDTMRAEIGSIDNVYVNAEVDYVDYDDLDISDAVAVRTWLDQHGPYQLIINCAAITNVDGCERDEAGAYRVNAMGAENLARAAESSAAKFVHVSTNFRVWTY